MVEVLDKRFLNLSRPRRIFLVAESLVVVSGASVVSGLEPRFKLNRGRLLNKFSLLTGSGSDLNRVLPILTVHLNFSYLATY